jgi:hypothetical protein
MRVSEVARRRKDRPRMSNISSGDLTGMAVRLVTTTAPESSWRTHTGRGKGWGDTLCRYLQTSRRMVGGDAVCACACGLQNDSP